MICKHCGRENLDDSIYCIQCGRKLEADNKPKEEECKEYCVKCGYHNENKFVFCPNCGETLKKEKKTEVVEVVDNFSNEEYTPASNTPIILSVISLAISFVCCIPYITQIASIVLSIIAMAKAASDMKSKNPGNAKLGLILGIVSFVIAFLLFIIVVFFTIAIVTDPEFQRIFDEVYGGSIY